MARGRGGTRLQKQWGGATLDAAVISTAPTLLTSFSSGVNPSTILRTMGALAVNATPDGASDTDIISVGLGVVSDRAIATGSTAMPSPTDDADYPWVWLIHIPLRAVSATLIENTAGIITVVRDFDTRGMRRMKSGEELALVAEENTGEFGTVDVGGGFRFLFGL